MKLKWLYSVKSVSLLWVSSVLGALFSFSSQIVLARGLKPEDYGLFVACLATVTLLAPFSGFGIAQFWLKIFGEEGWKAQRWLYASYKLMFVTTTLVILVLLCWAVWGPNDGDTTFVSLILSLYVFGQLAVELVSAKFQLEEDYLKLSLWQLFPQGIRLVLLIGMIYLSHLSFSLINIAIVYTGVSLLIFFIGLRQLRTMSTNKFELKGHELRENSEIDKCKAVVSSPLKLLARSWPFGLAGFLFLIYYQSDLILVKYIVGSEAAGMYSVAFTIMSALYIFPSVIFQKFLLPKFHRWSNQDRRQFFQVYNQGNLLMCVLGGLAAIVIWVLSPWVVPFLFGKAYLESIELLKYLAITAPFMFLIYSIGTTLTTKEHMKTKVYLMGIVAVLNIAMNLLLIPMYGALGAVVATIISNAALLILYYVTAQKIVFSDMT